MTTKKESAGMTDPDEMARALIASADKMGTGAALVSTNALRLAAALISAQSETIGVLHTEHNGALAEIEYLRARLAEGGELLAEGVAMYDRQKAEIERLRDILIAMYQGGESLPSSVFHEVAGWVERSQRRNYTAALLERTGL